MTLYDEVAVVCTLHEGSTTMFSLKKISEDFCVVYKTHAQIKQEKDDSRVGFWYKTTIPQNQDDSKIYAYNAGMFAKTEERWEWLRI